MELAAIIHQYYMLDPNVKTVFPHRLGITAQPRIARAERSLP
jgi:hypothetical protein